MAGKNEYSKKEKQEQWTEALQHWSKSWGYQFKHTALLEEALTHSSYAHEHNPKKVKDNQRLEFLGDSVLALSVGTFLYQRYPEVSEGPLSKMRSSLVCEKTLSRLAENLGIPQYLRVGKGESQSGGQFFSSNLEDSVEALLGAIYLDSDFLTAKKFCLSWIEPFVAELEAGKLVYDYKSKFLEKIQTFASSEEVSFEIVDSWGPDHDRKFRSALYFRKEKLSEGEGKTKKAAEQEAARKALENFSFD